MYENYEYDNTKATANSNGAFFGCPKKSTDWQD
jgi:hypothetical protein